MDTTLRNAPVRANVKKPSLSVVEVRHALRLLLEAFGHEPDHINVDNLQAMADRLSAVAGREIPWGWRYLRNVLNGKLEASAQLTRAVMALGAAFDGVPVELAAARQVMVNAVGTVKPGALVLADSKRCANPACPLDFIPVVPRQRFHSADCRRAARKVV